MLGNRLVLKSFSSVFIGFLLPQGSLGCTWQLSFLRILLAQIRSVAAWSVIIISFPVDWMIITADQAIQPAKSALSRLYSFSVRKIFWYSPNERRELFVLSGGYHSGCSAMLVTYFYDHTYCTVGLRTGEYQTARNSAHGNPE